MPTNKKRTHKELDREWSKLTIELKEHGISEALRWKQHLETIRSPESQKAEKERREAERDFWDDWFNSPG
jgi:hypothetical protein